MRRPILLLATMSMALVLIAGVAFADTFNCISGRACIGTDGPDTLRGSIGFDYIDGRQGSDRLFGNERGDSLLGDAWDAPNNDTSTDGDDLVIGGTGYDELVGFGGSDTLYGSPQGDFFFAEESSENRGEDNVFGGRGNDYILAKDGVRDTIDCGPGKWDVVFFDKGGTDRVASNCEYRNRFPEFEEFSSSAASASAAEKVSDEKVKALRARN